MSRARDFADFISTGQTPSGILADGAIDSTEITGVTVSSTEINRLAGVTSDIQTQINTKAATASLAAVATSGAASDVTGLHAVATSGAYSDVTGTPSLGTAAALDVGTGANNIPQLDSNGKLGAIDGSALTGIQGFSYASTLAFGDY
tara:strand:+ start:259 stop:699 length:441 start_codon:yes stop_codon:yes gene_type:complete